jgi:hypothetical protein
MSSDIHTDTLNGDHLFNIEEVDGEDRIDEAWVAR